MELTTLQKQIIQMTCDGLQYQEIADQLKMKKHQVNKILDKLRQEYDCRNTNHLVYKYMVEFYG